MEKIPPDAERWVNWNLIMPDYDHPIGLAVNVILSFLRSDLRAIMVVHEDAVRAWAITTQDQAEDMANRLTIDSATGNFTDPKRSRLAVKIQHRLGLISG